MTPLWFAKHQQQVPALILVFFDIAATAGPAQDDVVKADINAIRTSLARSGFKTRFAAVLVGDSSFAQSPELEERLSSIRRATTLDAKTGLFFFPGITSQDEIASFVQTLLTALQPLCIEYYRDLTKHARRKKTRGSVPPTPTTALHGAYQTLSTPGWNARYEVKQAVFAEYRQEMDVAERHYSQAIDDLFNIEGMFESTPSWSPRWDESRLLCDAVAVRMLRCQLWNGMTTSAVQSWIDFKARMKDLVDRRGKGSQTYCWDAWESRWARIMAQLVQRAELPFFKGSLRQNANISADLAAFQTHAPLEKPSSNSDRLPPFNLLHHSGYWNRLALKSARARSQKALSIPEEDRVPPGQSPASSVAHRVQTYDTYLVPEPHEEFAITEKDGFDHMLHIPDMTARACQDFLSRDQTRMAEQVGLELARDFAEVGMHEDAMEVLVPLWRNSTWRAEGWNPLFRLLLDLLLQCARATNNAEIILATTWELTSMSSPSSTRPDDPDIHLHRCLNSLKTSESEKTRVSFEDQERLTPISARFAFASKDAYVGEPLRCQLSVQSRAPSGSPPITLSEIALVIPAMKDIRIVHDGDSTGVRPHAQQDLALESKGNSLAASANLIFQPGDLRVFDFHITFREAGIARLTETVLSVETNDFLISHKLSDERLLSSQVAYAPSEGGLVSRQLHREETTVVTVLPKPPKVEVILHGLQKQYYVGEPIQATVEFVNNETEAVRGTMHQRAVALEEDVAIPSRWQGTTGDVDSNTDQTELSSQSLEALESRASFKTTLRVDPLQEPLACTLTVDLDYVLESEPRTPLRKTVIVEMTFATPFEAKFNFGPLLNPDPWPSYFDPTAEDTEQQPSGVSQRWKFGALMRSIATETVVVKAVELNPDQVANEASCKVSDIERPGEETVGANSKFDRGFEILTQKFSLDDRRPTLLDLSLAISWSRESGAQVFTTIVPMRRLTVPSSEPRVLCTVAASDGSSADAVLHYHLENPSTHFLTFALTMDASQEFAFGGPKYRTLSLAPLSRLRVEYQLRLYDHGSAPAAAKEDGRWVSPSLQVVDSYYQKTLRVLAAGPGVKTEAQSGLAVWVPSG